MPDTTSPTTLLEPSFTDAIRLIDEAPDLPDTQRQHWRCSLRRIADGLERPPELIPARWTSIRMQVAKLHHARMALTSKTLANHKANVRAALPNALLWEEVPQSLRREIDAYLATLGKRAGTPQASTGTPSALVKPRSRPSSDRLCESACALTS